MRGGAPTWGVTVLVVSPSLPLVVSLSSPLMVSLSNHEPALTNIRSPRTPVCAGSAFDGLRLSG